MDLIYKTTVHKEFQYTAGSGLLPAVHAGARAEFSVEIQYRAVSLGGQSDRCGLLQQTFSAEARYIPALDTSTEDPPPYETAVLTNCEPPVACRILLNSDWRPWNCAPHARMQQMTGMTHSRVRGMHCMEGARIYTIATYLAAPRGKALAGSRASYPPHALTY